MRSADGSSPSGEPVEVEGSGEHAPSPSWIDDLRARLHALLGAPFTPDRSFVLRKTDTIESAREAYTAAGAPRPRSERVGSHDRRQVGRPLGGTVNDVVLAAVTGGLLGHPRRDPVAGPRADRPAARRDRTDAGSLTCVPIAARIRTGGAVRSYEGLLMFGFTADADHTPDLDVLRDGVQAGFEKLLAAAGQQP